MWFRGERQRIRSARRSGARRKIGAGALVSQRLFHVRRHTRGDDGSFEWYVLNRHTRRRASKNFENSAAAEARRAQLQATFDRHSRVRDDACHPAATAKTLPRSSPPRMRNWRVSLLRGRAQHLGEVEAPDERSAEAAAAAQFELNRSCAARRQR